MNLPVAVARGLRRALDRRLRRLTSSGARIRSPYARVRVRVAFHGFWPGFRLESFLAFHPYLKLECNVGECRRRPDVDFINVGYGRLRRDAHDIPLPGDGRPTVFYTGERVSPGSGRFDGPQLGLLPASSPAVEDGLDGLVEPVGVTANYGVGPRRDRHRALCVVADRQAWNTEPSRLFLHAAGIGHHHGCPPLQGKEVEIAQRFRQRQPGSAPAVDIQAGGASRMNREDH